MGKATPRTDGRHARSERTREAIVDVLLDLIEAGEIQPSAERIAELAGVSRRLVFHHFSDREELFTTAITRHMARVAPLLNALPTEGTLAERIDGFVAYRRKLFERVEKMLRVALHLEPVSTAIASRLRFIRALQREQVQTVFAPEIEGCPRAERAALIAALTMASSYTAWIDLTVNQELSGAHAARALKLALSALAIRPTLPPEEAAKESL